MTNNSSSDTPYIPKKSPLLLILVVALFAFLIAFSFYLGLRKSAIQTERATLDGEIAQLRTEIRSLEGDRVEAAQSAQAWLEQVSKREVRWSSVITRVANLIPVDRVTQRDKIEILSYSGGQGGKLSLNAQTRAVEGDPYPDAAEMIEVFNESSYFQDAYIPSLTRGEDDQGRKIATFLFNMIYKEEAPDISVTQELTSEDSFESNQVEGVPRQ